MVTSVPGSLDTLLLERGDVMHPVSPRHSDTLAGTWNLP